MGHGGGFDRTAWTPIGGAGKLSRRILASWRTTRCTSAGSGAVQSRGRPTMRSIQPRARRLRRCLWAGGRMRGARLRRRTRRMHRGRGCRFSTGPTFACAWPRSSPRTRTSWPTSCARSWASRVTVKRPRKRGRCPSSIVRRQRWPAIWRAARCWRVTRTSGSPVSVGHAV